MFNHTQSSLTVCVLYTNASGTRTLFFFCFRTDTGQAVKHVLKAGQTGPQGGSPNPPPPHPPQAAVCHFEAAAVGSILDAVFKSVCE